MKKSPQPWLTGRAAPPGTLACGLRAPDGKLTCHIVDEGWPAGKMEKILGQFDVLRAALFSNQPDPRWTTWMFELGQIRFVSRPDGWLLGLVVRPDSDAVPKLDPLSTEFLSLELE